SRLRSSPLSGSAVLVCFSLMFRPPPPSSLFPYTTLFRSLRGEAGDGGGVKGRRGGGHAASSASVATDTTTAKSPSPSSGRSSSPPYSNRRPPVLLDRSPTVHRPHVQQSAKRGSCSRIIAHSARIHATRAATMSAVTGTGSPSNVAIIAIRSSLSPPAPAAGASWGSCDTSQDQLRAG